MTTLKLPALRCLVTQVKDKAKFSSYQTKKGKISISNIVAVIIYDLYCKAFTLNESPKLTKPSLQPQMCPPSVLVQVESLPQVVKVLEHSLMSLQPFQRELKCLCHLISPI